MESTMLEMIFDGRFALIFLFLFFFLLAAVLKV